MNRYLKQCWRFIVYPKRLKHELETLFDYLIFYLRNRFISLGEDSSGSDKTVLFVSITNWIAQVKMEGMLATALRLKGYKPVILTYRSCKWAIRYFRVFGIRDFIFFDDILDKELGEVNAPEMEKVIDQPLRFCDALKIEYQSVRVGMHALSTLLRRTKSGSSDFAKPEIQEALRERVRDSVRIANAAERVFEKITPEQILFLEKGYTPYGEIFDVALKHGHHPVQFHHSQCPDALNVKRYGPHNIKLHAFSISPSTWKKVQSTLTWDEKKEKEIMDALERSYTEGIWFDRDIYQQHVKVKTAEEVKKELGLDSSKKTVVIFSHVLWDATFFYGSNLFEDYEKWLIETVKVACENDAVNWVIKLHPDYLWKMKREGDKAAPRDLIALDAGVGGLPDHIKIVTPDSDISTYSYFLFADYCLTVRGTVGIEASCFGIPVITAGMGGRYTGLGFTNDSDTPEEYLEKLRHIQDIPRMSDEEVRRARLHAYALFLLKPMPFTTFKMTRAPLSKMGSPFDHNVDIRAKSLQDIRDAQDLNTFSQWLLHSQEDDYLDMPL
ncbi:hypothetical protein KKC44_05665 [Patescibacteria group bacterium]|nr:hypothetical protein [Patescibacteria group bacterium]